MIADQSPSSFAESFPETRQRIRVIGKLSREIARTCLLHPSWIFLSPTEAMGYMSADKLAAKEEHRRAVTGGMQVRVSQHILERELGTPEYRLHLCDQLEDLRYENGLPKELPVQQM